MEAWAKVLLLNRFTRLCCAAVLLLRYILCGKGIRAPLLAVSEAIYCRSAVPACWASLVSQTKTTQRDTKPASLQVGLCNWKVCHSATAQHPCAYRDSLTTSTRVRPMGRREKQSVSRRRLGCSACSRQDPCLIDRHFPWPW